jgi:hypothetical protein
VSNGKALVDSEVHERHEYCGARANSHGSNLSLILSCTCAKPAARSLRFKHLPEASYLYLQMLGNCIQ